MKAIIYSLCFYIVSLAALPTVNVLRMHMAKHCTIECSKGAEMPSGCQKDKCTLPLCFSLSQFVLEPIQTISPISLAFETKEKMTFYNNVFPKGAFSNIWHPPEFTFKLSNNLI